MKQGRGERTVEQVLDATLACAVERGIHEVSIEAVCAASKVSVGSVYHHFTDRQGLVFALYRRCLERMLESIVGKVVQHTEAESGVKALVGAYLQWVHSHRDEARIIYGIGEGDFTEAFRAEIAALGANVIAPLAAWVDPFIESGDITPMPLGLLEVVLIGPAAEASRRILGGTSGFTFRQARTLLPESTWRAVTTRRAQSE